MRSMTAPRVRMSAPVADSVISRLARFIESGDAVELAAIGKDGIASRSRRPGTRDGARCARLSRCRKCIRALVASMACEPRDGATTCGPAAPGPHEPERRLDDLTMQELELCERLLDAALSVREGVSRCADRMAGVARRARLSAARAAAAGRG
jgi:hypothetical protein